MKKKRLLIGIIACFLILILVSVLFVPKLIFEKTVEASEETSKTLSLSDTNVLSDTLSFHVEKIHADTRIEPPAPSNTYTYYETKEDGYVYLDFTINVTNNSDLELNVEQFATVTFTIGHKIYSAAAVAEENDGETFALGSESEISANDSKVIHYLAEMSETDLAQQTVTLSFTYENDIYEKEFLLANVEPATNIISFGDTISKEDYAKITFDSYDFTKSLKPSLAEGGSYSYYKVDDEANCYLVIKLYAQNLKSDALSADKVCTIRVTSEDGTEYDCFSTLESTDGTNFEYTNATDLETNDIATLYYLAEIPKELKDSNFTATVNLYGDYYELELNLDATE